MLWAGKGAGRQWRARQVDAPGPEPGEVWMLVIETTDSAPAEFISSWWSPEDRVLGGTLVGWSKAAIGNLKRTLAQAPPSKIGETP